MTELEPKHVPVGTGWRAVAGRIAVVIVTLLLGLYLLTGFYMLAPAEQAIVERFGRPLDPDRPAGPGLHYALPWPIDRVQRADTGRVRTLALGYRGQIDPEAILWTNIVYEEDRPMLTGHRVRYARPGASGKTKASGGRQPPGGPALVVDRELTAGFRPPLADGAARSGGADDAIQVFVNARVFVHYRISDLAAYLYRCRDPEQMLTARAERLLVQEIGRRELFPMLSTQRDDLQEALQEALGPVAVRLGVAVAGVEIRDIHPPAPVAAAFEDVVSAMEDYETLVTHGTAYEIDTLQQAHTHAAEIAQEATGTGRRHVARSRGEAAGFVERLAAYREHPHIARLQLYLDALGRALDPVRKVIVPGADSGSLDELWLMERSAVGPPPTAATVSPRRTPGRLPAPPRLPSILTRPPAQPQPPAFPEKEL